MKEIKTVVIADDITGSDVAIEMNEFNRNVKDRSFLPGMTCLCLGYTGMEDRIVIVSPTTGRVGQFNFDTDVFLMD